MQPTPEASARGVAPLRRMLPLSGVAFAVLFLIGWFASGGDAPDYTAPDQAWATWAEDNQWRSRIGAFAMLLAGFVFLHYAGAIRSALGRAESSLRGSAQLAHVGSRAQSLAWQGWLWRSSSFRVQTLRVPTRTPS